MSAASHAGPPAHDAAPDGHDVHDNEAPHGSLQGYLIGFGLSAILTAIPFWLVMAHVFKSPTLTAFVVMGFAAVQIVVHMIYFLHMTPQAEGGWNLLALIFTLVLVTIALSGSLWVMYHLNVNMMPTKAVTAGDMARGETTTGNAMGGMDMTSPASAQDSRTMP